MIQIQCPGTTFTAVQAIIFDKDGTLAQSEYYLRSLAQRRARLVDARVPGVQTPLLLAFGVEADQLNPSGLMAVASRQESLIAAAAYVAETGRSWAESLQIVQQAFQEADQSLPVKATQTPPIAGTLTNLQSYRAHGLKLAVISADVTANIQDFLDIYQLAPFISAIAGADQTPSKPHPDCFRNVCQQLGVEPTQTLMVGDAQSDIDMALAAGALGTLGVTWGWRIPPQISDADVVINTWSELQLLPA
jgi:phosphoglycolate phosphatase